MRKKFALMLTLVFVLLSVGAFALAAGYGTWGIGPGERNISGSAVKSSSGAMSVSMSIQTPATKVCYRGRNADSEFATTAKRQVTTVSYFTLSYLSGEGVVNKSYKLAVENSTSSLEKATVKGTFTP